MLKREVEVHVVYVGEKQKNSFFGQLEKLFTAENFITHEHPEEELKDGRKSLTISFDTQLCVMKIRKVLEGSSAELVMVFCPHEKPEIWTKRKQRRTRGRKRSKRQTKRPRIKTFLRKYFDTRSHFLFTT